MFRLLLCLLPICGWLFIAHDFINLTIPLNMDTNTIYGVTKYYMNNLANGVVPLWEPFINLGRPFYALVICNLFNPFTYLVLILHFIGVNYAQGFIAYMIVYMLFGVLGFYFLVKTVTQSRALGYLGALSLLFSTFSISIFTQFTFVEMITPAIWFFYFAIRFVKEQRVVSFLGLTASAMMIAGAYLPFYFATVAATIALCAGILYVKQVPMCFGNIGLWLWHHKLLTAACVCAVGISLAPLAVYKHVDAAGDVVAPGRHCQYTTAQECYERTMSNQGGMIYEEIDRSGILAERFDFASLFVHQDKTSYGSDSIWLISPLIILLCLGGAFQRVSKEGLVILMSIVVIASIALAKSGVLHPFVYAHIPFFKFFRNLFFFGAWLVPMVILLAMIQLKSMLAMEWKTVTQMKMAIVVVIAISVVSALWLKAHDGIAGNLWVTLLVVLVMAIAWILRFAVDKNRFWLTAVAIVLVMNPTIAMAQYAANAKIFACPLPYAHVTPRFQWQRPAQMEQGSCRIYDFVPYEDFWYAMSMQDSMGKVGYAQSAGRYAFHLTQWGGEENVLQYAHNKLYVYDAFRPSVDDPQTVAALAKDMITNPVATVPLGFGEQKNADPKLKPMTGSAQGIDVIAFDVNHLKLKTHFDHDQFLVYTDTYTQFWKVFIDGKAAPLVRANIAFKGVWVTAGDHTVTFTYQPPGGGWVYIIVSIANMLMFLIALAVTGYEMRQHKNV